MISWNKVLFDTPGEPSGAGGGAATPPVEPPANPTDSNPEKIGEADEWVLGHFDALVSDDANEDIDAAPVEPAAPIPASVSPQGEKPEGVSPPSPPTREVPQGQPALATPAVLPVVQAPSAPVVGAVGNQTVSQVPLAPTSPPDPTRIMADIARGIQEQKAAFIDQLAKSYEMTEKEADDLGFTPEQARYLARAQARAQVEATASITQMQSEQLPAFVNGIQAARSENQRREDEFFGQYPELRAAPKDQLARVFQAVNGLHPNLRGADWSKKAGEMALVSLGIQRQQQPVANGQVGAPQTIRTPGPIVRQTNGLGHLPIGTSTAPAPVAPQLSETERFFQLLQQTDAGVFDDN